MVTAAAHGSARIERRLFLAAVVCLALSRFFFFGDFIDEPHQWRQMDTAQYIRSFYEEGIDLLHPSVAWMGGHKTLVLEFPMPEAMTAVLYRAFWPDLNFARLVSWGFFCGAALLLYWTLRMVTEATVARLAVVIYLAAPLGFYYSRAIHVDSSAIFFAHATIYLLWSWMEGQGGWRLVASGACAALALLIKAPYVFYLALPVVAYTAYRGHWRRFLGAVPVMAVAGGAFLWWRAHTVSVNGAAPDWSFIPGYMNFVDMNDWYFGTWAQRIDAENWQLIANRLRYEVLGGTAGVVLFVLGLFWSPRDGAGRVMLAWLVGTLVYVTVFWPLNVIHNYYHLPFLAPLALYAAHGVVAISRRVGRGSARTASVLTALLLAGYVANSARLLNRQLLSANEQFHFQGYFVRDRLLEAFGRTVAAHTAPGSLVVTAYRDLDCRAPHVLFHAHRYGWNVPAHQLTLPIVQRFRREGAAYLAVMVDEAPRDTALQQYLASLPQTTAAVEGESGLQAYVWRFSSADPVSR